LIREAILVALMGCAAPTYTAVTPAAPSSTARDARERMSAVNGLDVPGVFRERERLRAMARDDASPEVRAAAIANLAYVAGDVDSVPALIGALASEQDPTVQRRLFAAIARFRTAEGVDALVQRYLDGGLVPAREADLASALAGLSDADVKASIDRHRARSPERAALLEAEAL
jgi:hypothetical protein